LKAQALPHALNLDDWHERRWRNLDAVNRRSAVVLLLVRVNQPAPLVRVHASF
jgi:hypothetical protein